MTYHGKSKLFSLIGRTVVTPYQTGTIIEKMPGRMIFFIRFENSPPEWWRRSEFHLIPLPRIEREPEWIRDDSDGFDYVGVEGF